MLDCGNLLKTDKNETTLTNSLINYYISKQLFMYSKRTFFEFISLANAELIHSQMVAWVLSKDFQGFKDPVYCRKQILKNFFVLENPEDIVEISTESDSIDILIKLDKVVLCIENKLKSSQHSDQLNKYKNFIDSHYGDVERRFYYLTLIEEDSENQDWINKSYKDLLSVLNNLENEGQIFKERDGFILEEYILTLRKLTGAVDSFLKEPKSIPNVFSEANLKKSQKKAIKDVKGDLQLFIRENQLETLFQKLYFREVLKCLQPQRYSYINETRGDAILGIIIIPERRLGNGKYFNFGLDFQRGSVKTFCVSTDYFGSNKNDLPQEILELFRNIHIKQPQFGYMKQVNLPKSKALCSVSKPLNLMSFSDPSFGEIKHWWELTPKQFAQLFMKEIELTNDLLNNYILIKTDEVRV